MKVLNKFQKILFFLMVIVLISIVIYVLLIFIPNKNKKLSLTTDKTIKNNYNVYSRDSELYRGIFDELEVVLNNNSIDYTEYAKLISQLFIIDFYTLDNKLNTYDIGGIQYLKDDLVENFKLNAINTIYKYVERNEDGTRKQKLPIVSKVELVDIKESTYEINLVSYNSYVINLKWEYKEDMGYDKNGTIIVIKDESKLYIVEKS